MELPGARTHSGDRARAGGGGSREAVCRLKAVGWRMTHIVRLLDPQQH